MIGSAVERASLLNEIDDAYLRSLATDQEKDKKKLQIENESKRLLHLMNCRIERLAEEPNLSDPHVIISVRHISLGTKTRLFWETDLFVQVYDWIGSLSTTPEHFHLLNHTVRVAPDTPVFSGAFNMLEMDKPTLMSPEGTVAFEGFGVSMQSNDSSLSNGNPLHQGSYDLLQKLRRDEKAKLSTKEVIVEVSRQNVYDDMISVYKKRNVSTHLLSVTFKDEVAVGDGVTRDVYSAFFHAMQQKMDGSFQLVPQPNFDEDELSIVGEIITHAFLQCEVYPLEICKSSLKYCIFGDVDFNELISSFMQFITPKEAEIIDKFKRGDMVDAQPIMDILTEYSIFSRPTPNNVSELLHRAANVALIRNPCFSFQRIIKGMGNFWKKLPMEVFDSIYVCTIPTPQTVINSLKSNEINKIDAKITTWLHRYIRSCTSTELAKFVRFITGSATFPPNTSIRVEFTNQPIAYLRPTSKTCFKILVLPRQYNSFKQMRDNLDIYIGDCYSWAVHDN